VLSTIAFGRAMTTLGLSKKKVGGLIHYRNIRLAIEPPEGRLGRMADGLLERAVGIH